MRAAPSHFASLLPLEECLGGRRKLYFGSADTAPSGRKTVVMWRPPIVAEWSKPPEANGKATSSSSSAVALRRGRSDHAATAARGATVSPATVARLRHGRKVRAGVISPAVAPAGDPLEEAGMVASTTTGERPRSDASTSVAATATTAGKAEDGAGGGRASGINPLRGLDGWRKGPTDNFYNKEYIKLLGAELPRQRSSGRTTASPEGGAVDPKTPPPLAARMASFADQEGSKAGAEDGGNGMPTRQRPVDIGGVPSLEPGGGEPTRKSERRAPATARSAKHATTRGSSTAGFDGVGVGASSASPADVQAEEANSNAVALEPSSMKGTAEMAALQGAEAGGGGASAVSVTEPTEEGRSAGGEDSRV